VALLYQLPKHPEELDRLIDQIRKRGIAFAVTQGLLNLTATKSGNDALLRHTLEEANRRRVNPSLAVRPSSAEALEFFRAKRQSDSGCYPADAGLSGEATDYSVARNWHDQQLERL
jgi:hypothetical protein